MYWVFFLLRVMKNIFNGYRLVLWMLELGQIVILVFFYLLLENIQRFMMFNIFDYVNVYVYLFDLFVLYGVIYFYIFYFLDL